MLANDNGNTFAVKKLKYIKHKTLSVNKQLFDYVLTFY